MGGRDPFWIQKESFDYLMKYVKSKRKSTKSSINIELVNENRKDKVDQKETKKLIVKKIGRNDMCPCGSGKKYKFCHGL